MKLYITKDAQSVGITNAISCFIQNIFVSKDAAALNEEVIKMIEQIYVPESIFQTDCYTGFKQLFTNLGYPNQTTACDKLIKHYRTKGFKSISNIVDAYNICSVLSGSPIGLHDAKKITSDVTITLSKGNEIITPMFKPTPKQINKGDLVYKDNNGVICWMGKEDVDSDVYKVQEDTISLFVMAIGNPKTTSQFNIELCLSVYTTIKKCCPDATMEILETHLL